MSRGLFDLPAPLFDWVDRHLFASLPAAAAVAVWALLAGVATMELYRLLSPQARIERLKHATREAQQRLSAYDGDLDGAWPLIRRLLGVSLQRVAIVLPATLVAAYPVIAVLVWASNTWGHHFPDDPGSVAVTAEAPFDARWVAAAGEAPHVQARTPGGELVLDRPVAVPVTVLHKREWWNWLVGNPAGYLPADAPVERIDIDLPRRELFAAGPAWLRGWEAVFIPVLFVSALAYKAIRRIH